MKRLVSIYLPQWPIERFRRSLGLLPAGEREKVRGENKNHGRGQYEFHNKVPTSEASGQPPFVLAERVANALIVTAVDPRGLAEGVFPGQRLADARACLPQLAVAPARSQADAKALLSLARWCSRYGPSTNCQGRDGIWVDISGVAHLFGGEAALLEDIGSRLSGFGLTLQIGLADTPGAAWALAHYGGATATVAGWSQSIAPPDGAEKAIARLPVEALRLEHGTVLLLRRLGLKRIGQLQAVPRASLKQRFSSKSIAEAVLERLDQAAGRLAEPLKPLVVEPVHEARLAFAEPLISHDGLVACLSHLAHDLCAQLEKSRVGLRQAELRIFRADGSMARLQIGTGRPCRQPQHLIRLFGEKINGVDAGFGVDLVVLAAVSVDQLEGVQTAFAGGGLVPGVARAGAVIGEPAATGDPAPIGDLIDRLSNRLGAQRVLRLHAHQSHLPERAQRVVPAVTQSWGIARRPGQAGWVTAGRVTAGRVTAGRMTAGLMQAGKNQPPAAGSIAHDGPPPGLLRPLLMLTRPERIDVLAEVPEGAPQRFRWRRLLRRVVRAEGPERIEPEWWLDLYHPVLSGKEGQPRQDRSKQDGPPGAIPSATRSMPPPAILARVRDYYRIEDDAGARYWIFRAGLYQRRGFGAGGDENDEGDDAPIWFLHGLFA